ncbi:hypothetical protein B0H10DRAFT_2079232 [Mycena sp. CBHHK59/15]|nr:hypothetical protein B0H10DRAFT_2079232 [Mycena sp. CBHHK59/15]
MWIRYIIQCKTLFYFIEFPVVPGAIWATFFGLRRNGSSIISSWTIQRPPAWQTSAKLEKQGGIGAWE